MPDNFSHALLVLALLMVSKVEWGERFRAELAARRMPTGMFLTLSTLSRTSVYDYLNGNRIPDPRSCREIARVLGVPFEQVMEWAGHIDDASGELPPPAVEIIPEIQVKLRLFSPEEQRRLVLKAIDLALALREDRADYDSEQRAAGQPPADDPPPPPGPTASQ